MFPGMPVQANKEERKLVKVFKSLDASSKESLLAFAEFLQSRSQNTDNNTQGRLKAEIDMPTQPLDIPRPDKESVIKGIKRLTATYPMVDKESILHPISALMQSHIMQGKAAERVIDELEELFENEYKKMNNNNKHEIT